MEQIFILIPAIIKRKNCFLKENQRKKKKKSGYTTITSRKKNTIPSLMNPCWNQTGVLCAA